MLVRVWALCAASVLALRPGAPHYSRRRTAGLAVRATAENDVEAPLVQLYDEDVRVGDRTLIRGLSLTVRRGARVAIVGPNGSGKTTLARLLGARVRSGGFDQLPASSAPQRPALGRAELGRGLDELRDAEALAGQATTAPSVAEETGERVGAHQVSFESHRALLAAEADEFAESRFTSVHKRATVASFLFPEHYPSTIAYPRPS